MSCILYTLLVNAAPLCVVNSLSSCHIKDNLTLNEIVIDQVNDFFFLFITHNERLINKVQIQGRHGSKNKKNVYIFEKLYKEP